MKYSTLLLIFCLHFSFGQNANWKYIRPSNTGVGGDYNQCLREDRCGNMWTGGYLPFWSEGAVTRISDSTFTCWSNFEGYLPADRVYDIAFDTYDGLWVATNGVGNGIAHGGISHYDGTSWTTYTSANSPMPVDDMRGIVVDHNNVVWATFKDVGTGIGGIVSFDGTNWNVYLPGASTFPTAGVDKITVDAQNNIWVGSNMGLIKFDGINWTLLDNTNSGLSNYIIQDVEVDETNNKLYAVTGNSVDIFDGTNWTHINSTNAPISATGLYSADARGDSVIITTVGGTYLTYVYDGSTWTSHPEANHTYDSRIDRDGNFWTCGIGSVEKFDGSSWTHYDEMNTGLTTMFNNDVFVDSKNRAWFASSDNGGINMFDCPHWQDYNPYNSNLWPQPVTYTGSGTGITEDSYGDIWMTFSGTLGAAVQVTGGDVNNLAAWHVWDNNNSGISLQSLNRAAADHSGNVWFGYDGACSVSKYSHSTNQWTNYNLYQLGQTTCGAGSGIKSIRVDDSDNVWICGSAGLTKYDHVNWTFYSYLNTTMQQGTVTDIAFDTLGNKWVATDNGLYKFDGSTWTKYDHTNSAMIGDNVLAVIVDKSGLVWAASSDPATPYPGSLCSFDGNTWTAYTTTNSGLQHNIINRLALDTLGNIWVLSETHGASIFNPNGVIGYTCLDKGLTSCSTTGITNMNNGVKNNITVFPNPFKESTTINFNSDKKQNVDISLYDVSGRKIKDVYNGITVSGQNEVTINIKNLVPGIYFCRVKTDSETEIIKIVSE